MIDAKTYDGLKKFEGYLRQTRKGYIRIATNEVKSLYQARYGINWPNEVKSNAVSCSSCRFKEVSKIADEYFAYVPEETADTAEEPEAEKPKKSSSKTKSKKNEK